MRNTHLPALVILALLGNLAGCGNDRIEKTANSNGGTVDASVDDMTNAVAGDARNDTAVDPHSAPQ